MKTVPSIIGILAVIFLLGWVGLQIEPKPFSPYTERTAELKTFPLPFGITQDHLIVRFNPIDHKVQFIEAMKYKNADNKVLWINGIWMDDGRPWLMMNVEEIVYNVDVSEYIRQREP